ncbi:hypothetical protein Aspvir_005008 [Aspergillus viridinutans]|uniref:Trichothecene 3-O-acetyltransferase-like N-terminal domain-containing protein n=1 Tax=Aspergillus viridinutans TaxID=75553 RepID=A0A9P3BUQ5_ASPVI|nr:uncharacterized protein Aspvir_005008 [Aspergillus viridinutans]GIK00978.1 hypothetical protein Aspvir_005008 [Aspergillus viridinutans]
MGSIEYREIPQLTPLERIAPKGYVRYIFLFHLGNDYNIHKISQVLQPGYETLAREIPEVACECIPDTDIQKKGVMKYRKIYGEDAARIAVEDLRDSFPLSFEQLKGKGFPVSYFDAETFCPGPIWPVPGEKVRTSLVQASFIRGGLILGWNLLHLSGDGTSWYIWTQIWADACRRAQGFEGESLNLPKEIWGDRERVRKPSGRNAGNIKDHPEWAILPFTPTSPPPKMMSPNLRGQIFYFSKDSLEGLKEEASPANATESHDQQWISTNDALSALLWRTVMAVQNPLETLEGDPTSVFNIAIDVSAPVRKILSTFKIADLALMIRKAILKTDEEWTDDTIALEEQLEDVDRLVATAFLDVPGFNCLQSSWVNFDLYGLEWGPVLGDRVEAIRTPHVGVVNGLQVMLPRLPDGGLEVLVCVEGNCLDKLLKDPLFTKFTVAR